jgi:serine/threonine protein kinase
MPSDAQVLCQIVEGLLYLHTVDLSHGNLTPGTVLIASAQPVRMMIKLSEFGLSKFGDQCDDSLAESNEQDGNGAAKKLKYSEELGKEPEDIFRMKYWRLDGTTDSNKTPKPNQDVFSAGCVCFYFLTRGVHPFGDDSTSIINNMKEQNPVNLKSNSFA